MEAPFKIGQRVKCVDASKTYGMPHPFRKGGVYTISAIDWFSQCLEEPWGVMVEEGWFWYNASRFAPITETYEDCTAEILEAFPLTEGGREDKVLTPEKIKL